MRRFIILLAALMLSSLCATAGAATIPLGSGQTFNQACTAASTGDTITVPAGTYSSQQISCTKAVIIRGSGNDTRVTGITFQGANGPSIENVRFGGMAVKASQNVTVRRATFNGGLYMEGSSNLLFDHTVFEPSTPGAAWADADMVDIYPDRNGVGEKNVTIQDSVFHGLRAPSSTAHSDAIQLYNSGKPHTGIKILRSRFYDNECINLRTNPGDELTIENNLFGPSVVGISGCGYYSIDTGAANLTARYNTILGQQIQGTASSTWKVAQIWTGNVGKGFNNGCNGGGYGLGTFSHNVWTGQKCGTTDKQVADLKVGDDGNPQLGSPAIDAGDPDSYPAIDLVGSARPTGAGPDAGAIESGGIIAPPPPADRDGDGVPDSQDSCPDTPGTQADGCNPPPPPPSDCTQTEKELSDAKAQIAKLTGDLADMTSSRDEVQKIADAYKTRAERAEDKLARIKAIAEETS